MRRPACSIVCPFFLLLAFIIFTGSCRSNGASGKSSETKAETKVKPGPAVKVVKIDQPLDNAKFSSGDIVSLRLSLTGNTIPDSVRIYFDGKLFATLYNSPWQHDITTQKVRLGKIPLKVMAFSGTGRSQVITRFVLLLSDISPALYSYDILNTYPHDRSAYTQGLVYHDGYLIESTGQEGSSSLRKVEIETGKVMQKHDLESKFFGEGIVLFNDRIYQLTYKHNTGFVYDLESFILIKNIHYDTQGWGITTDGEKLIMSDGTNKIFFIEPEYFTVLSSIEVFDNKGAVWQLNELEYINGEIWANIYMTDRVARIDPATGKVLGFIDLTGLLTAKEKNQLGGDEVLNGIAWDEESKRLFVTGKKWPKLFQIKVSK
ncbi:MAG: glutaminyl-peptide cyclotransferase [Bacteroidales bacterium]|nr:glutaminyl-peptide cyclotransferase [Bacteroidales bacterium]